MCTHVTHISFYSIFVNKIENKINLIKNKNKIRIF